MIKLFSKLVFLLLILSFLTTSLHAQNKGLDRTQIKAPDKIVEIDTVTGLVSGSIPFDQNFLLKKTYKNDVEPISFEVYEIAKDGAVRKTPKRRLVNNYMDLYEHRRPRRWRYKNSNDATTSFYKDSLDFRNDKGGLVKFFDTVDATHYPFPLNLEHSFKKVKVSSTQQAVYFYIPQLNPGKEYRFTFINSDDYLINKLYSAGKILSNGSLTDKRLFESIQTFNESKTEKDNNYKNIRWHSEDVSKFIYAIRTPKIKIPNLAEIPKKIGMPAKIEIGKIIDSCFYIVELAAVDTFKHKNLAALSSENVQRKNKLNVYKYTRFNPEYFNYYGDYEMDLSMLKDITGQFLKKSKSYCFFFGISFANSKHLSAPSRAYKFDGFFFVPDTNDTDITHNLPVELIHSPYMNFQAIDVNLTSINHDLASIGKMSTDLHINYLLKRLVKQAYTMDCSKASNLQDLICKNPKGFNLSIQKVLNYEIFKWKEIFKGYLPLNYDALDEAASENAYSARSKNLDTTIQFMSQLLNLAEILEAQDSVSYTGLNHNINTLKSQLRGNKEKLDSAHTKQLTIKRAINDLSYVHSASHHAGTTDVFEFSTRNTFRIVPDFGVIFVWRGTSAYDISEITPYLGFHINLRPINKNVPFRLVRYKTIWHRLSIMSGVTLSSLNISGQRENLFANFSLLTGVGFRLNNVVKLTGGTVWFKAMDPNPGIDRKRLAFSPYAGLSLDLDLQDLFGGISKLIK